MFVKKIIKKDPIYRAFDMYLPDLINAVFLFGMVGGGKSTTLLSLAQRYHDVKGYKIFDMSGGERNEHLYWCFPSKDKNYWYKLQKRHGLIGDGGKQYKINLLYPFWHKTLPKKLPHSPPNVMSKVFTIPIESVTIDDISCVIGSISDTDSGAWRECLEFREKNDNYIQLEALGKKVSRKGQNILRNFITPFCKNKILQSDNFEYNLDLESEFEDKEAITIFCLEFVPQEARLFILNWILIQMGKLLDKRKNMTKNIMLMREAAEFFRATDESIMPERYKVFRKRLTNYVRYGRRGMHLFFDAQSPRETRGIVSGQDDFTILCRMKSAEDIEITTAHLKKNGLIRDDQIRSLYRLEKGQVIFLETGKPAKLKYYLLPRTMNWQPGDGDFYEHTWKNLNNEWKKTESIFEVVLKSEKPPKPIYIKREKMAYEKESESEVTIAQPPLGWGELEERQKTKEKEKEEIEALQEEIEQII